MRVSTVLLALMVLVCTALSQAPHDLTLRAKRLTNDDVLQMTQAKLGDSIIIKAIAANEPDFDVSGAGLVALKKGGVSQSVMEAMLSASAGKKADSSPASVPLSNPVQSQRGSTGNGLPDEVGVYVQQQGKMIPVEPEIVNWRTGGVLKTLATAGLDKGHINGTIVGPHSALNVYWSPLGMLGPLEFYIRCPEGTSAAEYQLLQLWTKGNRREFRAVTGGVLHMSGGAQENAVPFKYEKVASRTYKITLSRISMGEYGFLAPGAITASSVASNGKMFTFRVPE